MDDTRFDAIAAALGRSNSRRNAVQLLVGGVLGTGAGMLVIEETHACLGKGKRCRGHGRCCSERCVGSKRKKCKCSPRNWWCNSPADCCESGSGCAGYTECWGAKVCCVHRGASCGIDCDCCGANDYCVNGRCGPLGGDTCTSGTTGTCASGFPDCGGTSECSCNLSWNTGPVCTDRTFYCEDDCSNGCPYEGEVCTVNKCCPGNGMACQLPCGLARSVGVKRERGVSGRDPLPSRRKPLP